MSVAVVGIEASGTDVEIDAEAVKGDVTPTEAVKDDVTPIDATPVGEVSGEKATTESSAVSVDASASAKKSGKKCPPLQVLHFYNNMSGEGGAKAIAGIIKACPQLHDFRFSATRSNPAGCEAIAEVMF